MRPAIKIVASVALGIFGVATLSLTPSRVTAQSPVCVLGGTPPVISKPVDPAIPVVHNNGNFDCMMWQAFISMNWPALQGQVGVPDPSKPLGTPGPTVWETFATVDQIFRSNGSSPTAVKLAASPQMNEPRRRAEIQSGAMRVLSQRSKVSPRLLLSRLNPNKAMVGHILASATGSTLHDIEQAFGGVLIDQNSQYVYYEELLNPAEVSYIQTNKLYDAVAQNAYAQSTGLDVPATSVELKAAWKVMGANDDATHFITSQALLDGGTQPVTVGLVGFHIILRAQGFQQGLWASFIQIEDAPLTPATQGHFSFYDTSCPQTKCPVNIMTTMPTPTQVQQIVAIDPDAATVNGYVDSLLASNAANKPFGYYRLLNVQWPTSSSNLPPPPQSVPLPSGSPSTNTFTNPVLETFLQTPPVGQNQPVSCLSGQCHLSAQTAQTTSTKSGPFAASYSFLFSHAQ